MLDPLLWNTQYIRRVFIRLPIYQMCAYFHSLDRSRSHWYDREIEMKVMCVVLCECPECSQFSHFCWAVFYRAYYTTQNRVSQRFHIYSYEAHYFDGMHFYSLWNWWQYTMSADSSKYGNIERCRWICMWTVWQVVRIDRYTPISNWILLNRLDWMHSILNIYLNGLAVKSNILNVNEPIFRFSQWFVPLQSFGKWCNANRKRFIRNTRDVCGGVCRCRCMYARHWLSVVFNLIIRFINDVRIGNHLIFRLFRQFYTFYTV